VLSAGRWKSGFEFAGARLPKRARKERKIDKGFMPPPPKSLVVDLARNIVV